MKTTRTKGQFEVPPGARASWERINRGGGSDEDLELVLKFLAERWEFDSVDPRGFHRWLLSQQGVEAKQLSPSQMSDQKQLYALDQEAKVAPTKELVKAILNGVHGSAFFSGMSRFAADFRVLVYQTAVTEYETEGVLYALASLSQEAQWIGDAVRKVFSDRPVLNAYREFALLKSPRVCLGLRDERRTVLCNASVPIDQLFCLATNPPSEIFRQLEALGNAKEASLIESAANLLSRLPDRGFGQFAKVNLALFICAASSGEELFDTAKEILLSTAEPNVANFLESLGKDRIRAELGRINTTFQPGHERLVAALIDAWRRVCDNSFEEFDNVTRGIKIKTPLVALAISAGTAGESEQEQARFRRQLTKGLQNVKDTAAREWLIRNREFIMYLPVGQASTQTIKAIFDATRSTPSKALLVSAQMLDQSRETTPIEHWQEALRALASIGTSESDQIFVHFVSERVKTGESPYIRDILAREPGATLLRRNLPSLVKLLGDRYWDPLFQFLVVRSAESTILEVVETTFSEGGALADWLVTTFLPDLLERQVLSVDSIRRSANLKMATALAKQLAAKIAADVEELKKFENIWSQKRAESKSRVLARITTGVQIAIHAAVPETRLYGQFSRLLAAVQALALAGPPPVDPVIGALASTDAPDNIPDEDALRRLFAHGMPPAIRVALLVGKNPGVVDIVLKQSGPWPKPELLYGQIAERFAHVAQVRRRSREQLETVDDDVRTEAALALRDVMSDIEGELAGYFAFREILEESGIRPVSTKLGTAIGERDLSSQRHKVIRDPAPRGRLRVFGLGIVVNDRVVSGSSVMNSGTDDDRD